MAKSESRTTEKVEGPRVRQFSVFLQNRVGVLMELVRLLNEHHVEVLAINLQESADSAIVRIVVSDPELVEDVFQTHDIPFAMTEFLVVELVEGAGGLGGLLAALLMAEINLHGAYALMTRPQGNTALALHVEDNECAASVLQGHGFKLLSQADLSR
jgi:hypothetical protein